MHRAREPVSSHIITNYAAYMRHSSSQTIGLVFLVSSHRVTVASHNSSDREEPEHLPYPATKLIVAQYWHCSRDPPFWGYLIIFAFQPDTRHTRAASHSEASSDSGIGSPEPTINRDLADRFSRSLNLAQSNSSIASPAYGSSHPPHPLSDAHLWDPSLAGPVPGHWVTHYDHQIGNWVNTWQSNQPSHT
ncbi:hypothetical protein LY76DRAFT_649622 [Colletotrichum caudatum]|nr:hypothetical protein LY76DRAFT_649622 [Colletotrichum caudatum]